ncbi:histidine phosphatase superfamily [Mycena rosella]|uniref:Histidine phosphatase superfamily n=1 Tax=Mycena rosella TaxID=1033263 RepID=A0AAD7DS12_MYCRO|nr:histidine phosphatase superfamily [Mycena rosella]
MFATYSALLALAFAHISAVGGTQVSSFAGATSTFLFPPAGKTITVSDPLFPDANQVGFAGPTPTGDEAAAIVTAPAVAQVDTFFPLINPGTSGKPSTAFDVVHHFGNLAPWRSVKSLGLPDASALVPSGCQLDQVHLLHRHGARYPTTGAPPSAFATLLHALASTTGVNVTGPLTFLSTWEYKLGAENLTPFGRSQLFDLGVGFRVKYGDLLKGFSDLPVFRTTSEGRMVDSALHFSAGFFGVQTYQQDYHQLIEIEALGFNSTLAPYDVCPNANNNISTFGTAQGLKWAAVYLAAAQTRLAPYSTGLPLSPSVLVAMQQLCAYETVALGYSMFCDLFTEDEWIDLVFWYSFGPGNPAVSAQGIGYVQELVSRLTSTRITTANTTVNETIVSSNVTFPFGQPIYVDATHDVVISAIVTAMNFTSLAANGPLPTDHIPPNHSYIVNNIAPFASNLVGQVLSCPATSASASSTHIRWILNDAVIPLTGIRGCKANSNGLCPLTTFIDGMKQRIQEVDFMFDCFANYTIPNPDNITTGQFPK